MRKEVWRPVNVWDGALADYYEVSNLGNVRSYCNGQWGKREEPKLLKPANPQRDYYKTVNLRVSNKKYRTFCIHQLVANAFIPNPWGCKYINHKDGNKKNDVVENLEWCTQKENMEHASRMNLMRKTPIRNVKTGEEYPSITKAGEATGINLKAISYCLNKGTKDSTSGGYHWEFVEKGELYATAL